MNRALDLIGRLARRVRLPSLVYVLAIFAASLWLLVWTSAAFAPARERGCPGESPWVRGVYHFHPVAHDDRDRSGRVREAVDSMCLDFAISTNHEGVGAELFKKAKPGPLILEGAEWRVEQGHHHGQLEQGENPFRVLNHPVWSKLKGAESLTDTEREMIRAGDLGIEALNVTRLLKTPRERSTLAAALLVGPGDVGHFMAALSEPGQDVDFWVGLQQELNTSIPMICGVDAHGDLSDYAELFPAAVLYLQPPADGAVNAEWITEQVASSRVLCVNEYLGRVPFLRTQVCGGEVQIALASALPEGAQWRLFRNGTQVGEGADSAVVAAEAGYYHLELWREVNFGILLGVHSRLWALGAVPSCGAPNP